MMNQKYFFCFKIIPSNCFYFFIRFRYDFFLVSQSVREGTVSPTGFNIIHDTIGIPPDRIQQLSFRFTYLYVRIIVMSM